MAYSTTYGCINSPGSSSDYITSGPYLAGAIRFTASRNAVNDPNVKVICDIYAGFGSYSNLGSYTNTPIYARPWYGSTSYSTASHSLNIAMNSGTWSRTSNTSQRLSTLGGLTATGYPTITSSTNQVLCSSINWTSGTKTFFIYFAGADGYQAKSVLVACPAYHADVTISYNANGGTGAPNSQTKIYGTNLTLRSGSPSRTGYTFMGWASSSTATTAEWQPGGTLSAEGARTLYAIWQAKTYTITYNSNGGSGTMANSTATYDQNFITRQNTFTKTGYTFNGWNTQADGSGTENWGLTAPGVYESGQSWKWTYTSGRDLYAQWLVNSYTLTADAGEGVLSTTTGWTITGNTATKTLTYNYAYGTLPIPIRANYNFDGWFTSADGGTQVTSNTLIGAENTTIYAHWSLARYTVNYSVNGGSGTVPEPQSFLASESINLASTSGLTLANYSATGWNTSPNTNQSANTHFDVGASFNSSSTTFTNNAVTLYVHWQGSTYTVTYDANGITATVPNIQTNNYGTAISIGAAAVASNDSYYFTSWNTKQDGSGDTYQPGETYNKYLTVTLYAQWESNDFSINFDSNYLQDYNVTRNQVAFGIESRDNAFNSHSSLSQGLYTTGIYVRSAILDNYGTGVLSGQLVASNLERALTKASYSSGIMGSINLSSAYTKNSITIPSGWHNYLYIPHRNGGSSGAAQSDNHNYGTMFITGMTSDNGIYKIRYNSGIQTIEQIYTTTTAYHRTSVGTLDWGSNPTYAITKGALAFWNGAYSGTSSNLAYCNKGAFGAAATKNIFDYTSSYGGISEMSSNGISEVGYRIDFHSATGSNATDYDIRIVAANSSGTKGGGSMTITASGGLTYGGATIKSFGWTQIGSGSNTTSKITFSSATTNYNEIMVVASVLRNGSYHLFSGILPSAIIDTTSREFKLSGGTGITTATNCGAWGGITTTGFTPVGVWINNTAFNSNTTWYIYGR